MFKVENVVSGDKIKNVVWKYCISKNIIDKILINIGVL